jgi:plastocyanin
LRSLRLVLALGAAAALCASAAAIAPAMTQPPKTAKLSIVGGIQMKAGKFIRDDQRFTPANREVRSGGSVRLRNRADTEDPHTISLVKKSDLPRTAQQAFNCEACAPFFGAHQVNEETGDVGVPVVNVGEPGFDQPGDSLFVAPGATVRFDISADRGKTLYYLCAVHPWMQGKLRVK